MENKIMSERREKAAALRERGLNPYANDFRVDALSGELRAAHEEKSIEQLEEEKNQVSVAGRVRAIRKFGKIIFG